MEVADEALSATYVTVREFAVRWSVGEQLVRRWIRDHMPSIDLGSDLRIPVAEGDVWVKSGGAAKSAARERRRKPVAAPRTA